MMNPCSCRISDEDVSRLADAVTYIHAHYPEDINIDMLSKIACMSATKFKDCFRKSYGVTVCGYVRQARMAEAQKLLLAGDLTVSAVAYTVGYLKPGAFTAAFKKHTGMLPKYYRKMQTHERRREIIWKE